MKLCLESLKIGGSFDTKAERNQFGFFRATNAALKFNVLNAISQRKRVREKGGTNSSLQLSTRKKIQIFSSFPLLKIYSVLLLFALCLSRLPSPRIFLVFILGSSPSSPSLSLSLSLEIHPLSLSLLSCESRERVR